MEQPYITYQHPFFNQFITHRPYVNAHSDGAKLVDKDLGYRVTVSADGGCHQYELPDTTKRLTIGEIFQALELLVDERNKERYKKAGMIGHPAGPFKYDFDERELNSFQFVNGGFMIDYVDSRIYVEEFVGFHLVQKMENRGIV